MDNGHDVLGEEGIGMALFDRKHNARVAQLLKETYRVEMTPEQLDAERRRIYAKLRASMANLGDPNALDLTDEEMFGLIEEAMRGKPKTSSLPFISEENP